MMKQLIIFFGICISSQLFAGKAPRLLPAQRRDWLEKGRVVVRLPERPGNQLNNALAAIAAREAGPRVAAAHVARPEQSST